MFKGIRTEKKVGIAIVIIALIAVGAVGYITTRPKPSNSAALNTKADTFVQAQVRNFTLYVRSTWVRTPDGARIFAFGFTDNPKGEAKIPAPPLIVNEGDTVNITLVNDKDPTKTQHNTQGDGHTIHLHGLDLPAVMDGDPMTSPQGRSILPGEKFLYSFVARHPGTYWYHCHEGAAEHIQMGMYGALVVRPRGAPNMAYPNTPAFDKEYTFVLGEMDSGLHQVNYDGLYEGKGGEPNWTQYRPNYFFINGKAWPDTMADKSTHIEGTLGQTVLVRLINTGYALHAMHSHGFHFLVVGTDGRRLDAPYYKDTLSVAPGERYDVLFKLDQPGRFMFHDHVENTNTNNGEYPGGMITMISVNNPDGSNPVPMRQVMPEHVTDNDD
jgi:FtsP/CotA-like multicopper oxidase with cupredoxin domain